MSLEKLIEAEQLAARVGHVFVATADSKGWPHIAVADAGYQLIGEVEEIKSRGMLDGYVPHIEGRSLIPQEERQLLVRIIRIVEFKRAPHSDVEE